MIEPAFGQVRSDSIWGPVLLLHPLASSTVWYWVALVLQESHFTMLGGRRRLVVLSRDVIDACPIIENDPELRTTA